jgi:hypothetical protein
MIKKLLEWSPCWLHIICIYLMLYENNLIAAWFAGMTAFYAFLAIMYRQHYLNIKMKGI